MAELTEAEIFDCLRTNLRAAVQSCDDLARLPKKGPSYLKLRDELKLIEGACRQAAYWRQDSRWFQLGMMMEEVHKRAGTWLRGYRLPDGTKVMHREGTLHPMFTKLGDNLRAMLRKSEELKTARSGRTGMILPAQAYVGRREGAPVQVRLPSGLIVPAGAA